VEALPRGRRRTQLEKFLQELMEDYPVLPFDRQAALAWGRYVTLAQRPLPVRDSLIAATAIANNLEVVTENTRDFAGIETINPIED
jgi:predicted nucleic acid-binding protein